MHDAEGSYNFYCSVCSNAFRAQWWRTGRSRHMATMKEQVIRVATWVCCAVMLLLLLCMR